MQFASIFPLTETFPVASSVIVLLRAAQLRETLMVAFLKIHPGGTGFFRCRFSVPPLVLGTVASVDAPLASPDPLKEESEGLETLSSTVDGDGGRAGFGGGFGGGLGKS